MNSDVSVPDIQGTVFCETVEDHELTGEIASVFRIDPLTVIAIDEGLGDLIFNSINEFFRSMTPTYPSTPSHGSAYVVSSVKRFRMKKRFCISVLIIYKDCGTWFQAVAKRVGWEKSFHG